MHVLSYKWDDNKVWFVYTMQFIKKLFLAFSKKPFTNFWASKIKLQELLDEVLNPR